MGFGMLCTPCKLHTNEVSASEKERENVNNDNGTHIEIASDFVASFAVLIEEIVVNVCRL